MDPGARGQDGGGNVVATQQPPRGQSVRGKLRIDFAKPLRSVTVDADSETLGVNACFSSNGGPQFYFQTGHERLVMTSAVIRQPNAQWWKGK